MHPTNDRNFDDLVEHFAKKIYGGLKGQIRLAVLQRDLDWLLAHHFGGKSSLKVLDIGAGLGQISLYLSGLGHCVTLNDISVKMLEYAQAHANNANLSATFITAPYQDLPNLLQGQKFDIILCHALLEWVDNPQILWIIFEQFLADQGVLSLCFYNPKSLIYRNLVMGNFNYLNDPKPANMGSLTPNNPVDYETVQQWLSAYQVLQTSGIRVFYDYTTHKRGGLSVADDVIQMELKYSQTMPFVLMGRYVHVMATKNRSHLAQKSAQNGIYRRLCP